MIYYRKAADEMTYLLQYYTESQIDSYAKGSISKIKELFNICQPKKVPIGSLMSMDNTKNILVSSPDGYVPVVDCIEKIKEELYTITFSTGECINASHDHLFQKSDLTWSYAREINAGDLVIHKHGTSTVKTIKSQKKKTKVYDLSVNHNNHRYYTDNICSHNSGKSVFLANMAVNWCLAGMNVLYLTFELSENLVSMRVDSMVTGIASKDIFRKIDDVEMKVKLIGKKSGAFQVKYMPTGKTANDLRSYIKEYETKTGKKVDAILVDYLDLMHPIGKKISAENLFVKDKYVSEELRNLSMELNTITVSASQLNRSSVEEIEFDHSHISGGISKINTADNLFGIFTSRAMRERGRYQLQLMKTRSSSGVGSKIDLNFDIDSLRITDLEEGEESMSEQSTGAGILNQISRNQSNNNKEQAKVRAETESTKLRQFLNTLNTDEV